MIYRALSPSGDYVFGKGQQDYLTGDDALCQAIKTRILLFYGEWWEDLGQGIPMFQSILGQANSQAVQQSLELLVTQRVQEFDEVKSVSLQSSEVTERTLHMVLDVVLKDDQERLIEVNI